jgi:hypothetical protein
MFIKIIGILLIALALLLTYNLTTNRKAFYKEIENKNIPIERATKLAKFWIVSLLFLGIFLQFF